MTDDKRTDAPARYHTPQRPGQTGAADQTQPGPSPTSPHPTGPHAPYEPDDKDGLAAEKHMKPAVTPG